MSKTSKLLIEKNGAEKTVDFLLQKVKDLFLEKIKLEKVIKNNRVV